MNDTYFPPVGENEIAHLKLVQQHLIEDGEYLERPGCPYSPAVKRFLGTLVNDGPAGGAAAVSESSEDAPSGSEMTTGRLVTESEKLFQELRDLKDSVSDPEKRAVVLRTTASVMEKVIANMERAKRLKEFDSIIETILSFMEDNLDPDMRTKFMDHIKEYT